MSRITFFGFNLSTEVEVTLPVYIYC